MLQPPPSPQLPKGRIPPELRTPYSDALWRYEQSIAVFDSIRGIKTLWAIYTDAERTVALYGDQQINTYCIDLSSTSGGVAQQLVKELSRGFVIHGRLVTVHTSYTRTFVQLTVITTWTPSGVRLKQTTFEGSGGALACPGPDNTVWESHIVVSGGGSLWLLDAELCIVWKVRVAAEGTSRPIFCGPELVMLAGGSIITISRDGAVVKKPAPLETRRWPWFTYCLRAASANWILLTAPPLNQPAVAAHNPQMALLRRRRHDEWDLIYLDNPEMRLVETYHLDHDAVVLIFDAGSADCAYLLRIDDIDDHGRVELLCPFTLQRGRACQPIHIAPAAYAAREVATVAAAVAAIDEMADAAGAAVDDIKLVRAVLVGFLAEDARLTALRAA